LPSSTKELRGRTWSACPVTAGGRKQENALSRVRRCHLELAISEATELNLVLPDGSVDRVAVKVVLHDEAVLVLGDGEPGSSARKRRKRMSNVGRRDRKRRRKSRR
jgi:hypothetical protein